MIEATEYSMAQLEEILSALDGQKRNPCSKKAAIRAIGKKAEALGISADDVFGTAAVLLNGALTAEEWVVSMLDEAPATAEVQAEAEERIRTKKERIAANLANIEKAEAQIEVETAIKTAIGEIAKTVEITEEEIAEIRAKQDRFLATVASLDAAAEEPEEAYIIHNTGPLAEDDVPIEHLTLSKKGKKAVAEKTSKPRENSKQASVIAMLRRPEGATVLQISEEMGWLKHTTRAFVSATLGKKLGLNVTSGKIDGQRVYRIED